MPIFTASTPMSSTTARTCPRIASGGIGVIPVTATVFCQVTAVIAVMPCTPQLANAFRSAWIPAPPPESDPAIDRTRGVVMGAFGIAALSIRTRTSCKRTIRHGVHSLRPARARRTPGTRAPTGRQARPRRPFPRPGPRPTRSRFRRTRAACAGAAPAAQPAPGAAPGAGPRGRHVALARTEQRVEHVGGRAHHRRALGQQPVRTGGQRARRLSGHRADVTAEILREARGDQGSGALRPLHHDRHPGERRHDPVASRKAPAERAHPRWHLGHGEPAGLELLVQASLAGWVGEVHPARHDRDRRPAGGQRPRVRCGVGPVGHPADDRHVARRQVPRD